MAVRQAGTHGQLAGVATRSGGLDSLGRRRYTFTPLALAYSP